MNIQERDLFPVEMDGNLVEAEVTLQRLKISRDMVCEKTPGLLSETLSIYKIK
jgi:hypothetical protein